MRLALPELPPDKANTFMQYLNAAFRRQGFLMTGSAGFEPDGTFVAHSTRDLVVDGESYSAEWTIRRSDDGAILSIDVTTPTALPRAALESAAQGFIAHVLAEAFVAGKTDHFRRSTYLYVGPNLDGEYWLPGFRFAPALADDESPAAFNLERVVVIDQNVQAVDSMHATELAAESAIRWIGHLSFILDVGITVGEVGSRWVLDESVDGSRRASLGFSHRELYTTKMPKKGKACKLGLYRGSITDAFRVPGVLHLPKETRRILRTFASVGAAERQAFDAMTSLYTVALVSGRRYPTVQLAYMVAGVEAIVTCTQQWRNYQEFMDAFAPESPELSRQLYGSVRSAHFHAGRFPLGDLEPWSMDMDDPLKLRRWGLGWSGRMHLRIALLRWVMDVVQRKIDVEQSA